MSFDFDLNFDHQQQSYPNFLFSDSLTKEEVFTIFCWPFEDQYVSSELSAVGAKRGVRTHENCTLPTINLGPAGRRPALGLVYEMTKRGPDFSVCIGCPACIAHINSSCRPCDFFVQETESFAANLISFQNLWCFAWITSYFLNE